MPALEALLVLAARANADAVANDSSFFASIAANTAVSPTNLAPPQMRANLVLRVLLAFIANLVCYVPLRLLLRTGEFAASVLILTVVVFNLLTVVNSLLWPSDDIASWYSGNGWCDIHTYLHTPLVLIYTGCILAIMRNLAQQLGSMRASALTSRERTRRSLVQALIIFPIPLVQLAWVYPLSLVRFAVAPLAGCVWVPDQSWPFIIFFCAPAPLLALLTAYYAVLTYSRFRAVQKTTRSALGGSNKSSSNNNNRLAAARAHRAERRLFFMTLSILIPYLPLTIYFSVDNIRAALPLRAYDFAAIHDPTTWFLTPPSTSAQVGFAFQSTAYVPILTAVPIFWFFGLTKDAINEYRKGLLLAGLGRVWPHLREEYHPDASLYSSGFKGSRLAGSSFSTQKDKDVIINTTAAAGPLSTPPSSSPPQTWLSKLSWAIFGFGRQPSHFATLSSDDLIAAASHRPGLFSRFGATTARINSVVMHSYSRHDDDNSASAAGHVRMTSPQHTLSSTSSTTLKDTPAGPASVVAAPWPARTSSLPRPPPTAHTTTKTTHAWMPAVDESDAASTRAVRGVVVTREFQTESEISK